MAWKLLLLPVIMMTLCHGSLYKQSQNALGKQGRSHRHGNNKYNAAKKVIDYDEILEEQEENDLFLNNDDNDHEYNEYENNNNNEYEEYQVPQRRYKRRDHRRHNPRFSSQIMDDDSFDDDEDDSSEEYSDKEQLVAFLLSFFLGAFGAGRFYVGDYTVASIKLCLPLILCVACCIMVWIGTTAAGGLMSGLVGLFTGGDGEDDELENTVNTASVVGATGCLGGLTLIGSCLMPCGICAWQIWWLVDWILFAMNEIPDGDGKTLIPW